MSDTVTSLRRQLGERVRRARAAAGMTQQALADHLGCGQGKINKIESGAVSVKQADLDLVVKVLRVADAEAATMARLARAGDRRGEWAGHRAAVPAWFREFTGLEPTAAEILSWHGERIPGPLQSEHYMLKQFVEAGTTDVTPHVRNRLARKEVFTLPRPPCYRFILGEAAFHRMPGGPSPAVALDQVQHLIELDAQFPRTFIHVLPFSARLPFVPNDFTVMRFADITDNLVYVEHVAGGDYVRGEEQFEAFVDAWDQLRGAVLERRESVEFLRELAERFRSQLRF
ncbi:helix-turn-helix domain-containing protein [Umezawaea beigongshangensis]|uniref:helix-turn-helix domain-containing protein n=1 Tax=Umezawaea beigongshangensis TaxID=2780383 RepID=UPI0018F22254|nr:helix-turn-helix transcriptional regulator [Umezawaea beigongshangensis]